MSGRLVSWAAPLCLIVAGLWLVVLMIVPVYIEPGNGSIRCGRPWRSDEVEEFLAEACDDAVGSRRAVMAVPAVVGAAGVTLIALRRRDRQTRSAA